MRPGRWAGNGLVVGQSVESASRRSWKAVPAACSAVPVAARANLGFKGAGAPVGQIATFNVASAGSSALAAKNEPVRRTRVFAYPPPKLPMCDQP